MLRNQLKFSPLIFPFIMLSALDLITFVLSVCAQGGLPSRGVQWLLNTSLSFDVHGVLFIGTKWTIITKNQDDSWKNN